MIRSRLRNQEQKEKKLSKASYESLCRKACANPKQPESNETVEDAYWWSVCREVYHYLNVHFSFQPIEGASRGHVYRHNLLRLVSKRQTSLFDPLAIASKYINQALGREDS
jgi:hypothetical protein